MLEVSVRRLDPDVPLPAYAHPGDAGCDLVTTSDADVAPGERVLLGTGLSIALPEGYAAFVHPRSGLAARHGVGLVNSPGTVDAGYRGEIKLVLVNHDPREVLRLRRLDRVAQLVVQRVEQVAWTEVADLPDSVRGTGGHGSTGGFGDRGAGGTHGSGTHGSGTHGSGTHGSGTHGSGTQARGTHANGAQDSADDAEGQVPRVRTT